VSLQARFHTIGVVAALVGALKWLEVIDGGIFDINAVLQVVVLQLLSLGESNLLTATDCEHKWSPLDGGVSCPGSR